MRLSRNNLNLNHSRAYYAYALLMCVFVCKGTLMTYISATLNRLPVICFFSPIVLPVTIIVLIVLAYRKSITAYIRSSDVLFLFIFILLIVFTIIIYPENEQYLWYNFNSYIALCLPAYFVGLCSVDYDEDMFRIISIVSCISVAASYLLLFYYNSVGMALSGDELGQSYAVLPSTLFIISFFIYKKSPLYFVFSILGIFYALMLGSRGPIILIAVFIGINILIKKKNKKRWLLVAVIAIGLYIFYNNGLYQVLLLNLRISLQKIGYSTRIVDLALGNELISHDSGRNEIYARLLNLLKERPFLGYGLFGEWQFNGWNAHNIYLEVVFEYGWPIGILLIVWYLSKVIRAFLLEKEAHNKAFMLIFITFVLIQGGMSYSHLRPELFLLLGFCLKQRRALDCRKLEINYE